MNWVTTNIRLPENIYMDLKIQAARERKSIASIIRERITRPSPTKKSANSLQELRRISNKMEKEAKGLNLTKLLIEDRYKHS